jgi:hypothetical protein
MEKIQKIAQQSLRIAKSHNSPSKIVTFVNGYNRGQADLVQNNAGFTAEAIAQIIQIINMNDVQTAAELLNEQYVIINKSKLR